MGLFDSIPGAEGVLSNINPGEILGKIGGFALIIILFIFMMGIIYTVFWFRKQKQLYNKKIYWFEEVHGEMVSVDNDLAAELIIPNTNIQVFYIKKKDLYLPRPVIRMGKDSYWFAIRNNREIVNFSMKNINSEMKEANLNYDHTDMRYALTNLRELIKRNYRDKSQKWWQEYKEVISLILLVFVMSLSFFFLLSKLGSLIDKVGVLIDHADQVVKTAEVLRGSGVKQT